MLTYAHGPHRLYQGDALAVLPTLPHGSVDLLFLDPPYNIGKRYGDFVDRWPSEAAYLAWCWQWLEMALEKLSPRGSLYLMASTQTMPYFDLWLRERLSILSRLVWTYDSSGVQARKRYGSLYEPLLFAVKDPRNYTFNAEAIRVEAPTGARRKLIDYRKNPPQAYASTKVPGNVWAFPRVRYRMPEYAEHPSQKPEALLERVILASSQPGDTVLDPFAGTLTTAAVAQRLGRVSVSIEQHPDYVQAGLQRLGWPINKETPHV
ncbi:MAG: adenine-specific DNA-methyltransferase [Candidatus Sericytochromatia bacterium]